MPERDKFLEELYLENRKRIFDFLFRFSNNFDTAMELMQDTFVSYIKNYSEREYSKERATMLLYTIARNLSINYSKKFSTIRESHTAEVDHFEHNVLSFEKKLENKDLETQLQNCLNELPEDLKTSYVLRILEDLSLSQIAEIMEISISTASRLVVKAQRTLYEMAKERKILS
ncbi:MAG: sigma-70 family RNA polymerase sigma factor [Leptospiraceae bacterium]|nr:sigma-70 family RNA polymerase sigma factor [Leptospiraceae bacterium]MCP5510799.1 sigma-70 family RNA polymerase sigma factor [Leptospiraceae bacterium]